MAMAVGGRAPLRMPVASDMSGAVNHQHRHHSLFVSYNTMVFDALRYGLVRMLSACASMDRLPIGPFRDVEAALQWLEAGSKASSSLE
jgi:hypothetical protein